MKFLAACLTFSVFLTSCKAQKNSSDSDFIRTSQKLLRLISKRDSTAIFKLMWSESAIENKKGDIIKNDLAVINKYLDTIPDIKKLPYTLNIFNYDPVNYAVVSVSLKEGEESFKIKIFFAHPELKHEGQILTFDFQKTPKSFKLNNHPKVWKDSSQEALYKWD